jgi:hypothetical protein
MLIIFTARSPVIATVVRRMWADPAGARRRTTELLERYRSRAPIADGWSRDYDRQRQYADLAAIRARQ